MAGKTRGRRADAVRLVARVRRTVDQGTTRVEKAHKSIAETPLEVLEEVELFEQTAKEVRKLQNRWIGAVYNAIRRVNHEVTGFAREMLRSAPARKPAQRKATKKPAKAKAEAQGLGHRAAA
jgi:hypothetical protein